MGRQPEKIRLHEERERVLALSRLFAPDPDRPGRIAPAALSLPLPVGLSSRSAAASELTRFLDSPFPDVRRLAASALGKMATERPLAATFVPRLAELALSDPHPQVRQYAAKAVARYPEEGYYSLDELKDVARDETAAGYVRQAAAEAVAAIQESARRQSSVASYFCRRCRRRISQDEYRASMERFGSPYCHHCQDEKELESHDFESTVEAAKKKRTTGGIAVQSWGEKRIAEFLEAEKITYYYDERYRISGADTIRPDFYLPEFDLYIEYYGMDTPEYNENRRRKHFLYQRAAKKLISVSFRDDADLIGTLKAKLSRYIRLAPADRPIVDSPSSLADRPTVDSPGFSADRPIVDSPSSPADRPIVDSPSSPADRPIVDSPGFSADRPIVDSPSSLADRPIVDSPGFSADRPIVDSPSSPADRPIGDSPSFPSRSARPNGLSDPERNERSE